MKRKNIQIEEKLIEKAENIAKAKYSLRNISSTAEAIREILIEFIKNNKKYLKKTNQTTSSVNHEEAIKTTQ